MKIIKIAISFIVIVFMLSAVSYAEDSVENTWKTSALNGASTVSADGKDITLSCSTSRSARASAEATSPILEGANEKFDIYLSFNLTLSDFDVNRRAAVTLQSPGSEYALSLFTLNGSADGAEIVLLDETVCDFVIENGVSADFYTAFNIKTGAIRVTIDGKKVFDGSSELVSYLNISDLNVSLKSIFTTSLRGNSCVQFRDFSLAPGLHIGLSSESLIFKQGGSVRINVSLPETSWDSVSFYSNGTYVGKISYGEATYFDFFSEEAGEFTIKAVVSDLLGNTAETSIDLICEANKLPTVSFNGLSDGQQIAFDVSETKELVVNASDEDGYIDRIEIYRFGELVKVLYGNSGSVDLDEIGILFGVNSIRAIAYDDSGASSSASVSVKITKYSHMPVFFESEFKKSGDSYGSGMTIMCQRGFAIEKSIDAEHGLSLVLGMDENCDTENFTEGQYTFTQYPLDLKNEKLIMEFDICITETPTKEGCILFGIRRNDAIVQDIMYVDPDGLSFVKGDKYPLDDGWHHVTMEISLNPNNQYYSASVDEETVADRVGVNFSDSPTHFRFFTTTDPSNIGAAAIDNIEVVSEVESPCIIGVGTHEAIVEGNIDVNSKELGVFLSGSVNREDVNSDNVKIYVGSTALDTDLIRYNLVSNCIEVTMAEPLFPDTEYRIVLSDTIRFDGEMTFGLPMEYHFVTTDEGLTVNKVTMMRNGENLNITLETTNLDNSAKDIYVFVNFFDGDGRLCETKLFKKTLSADSTDNEFVFDVKSREDMEPYIFVSDAIKMNRIYYAE